MPKKKHFTLPQGWPGLLLSFCILIWSPSYILCLNASSRCLGSLFFTSLGLWGCFVCVFRLGMAREEEKNGCVREFDWKSVLSTRGALFFFFWLLLSLVLGRRWYERKFETELDMKILSHIEIQNNNKKKIGSCQKRNLKWKRVPF